MSELYECISTLYGRDFKKFDPGCRLSDEKAWETNELDSETGTMPARNGDLWMI